MKKFFKEILMVFNLATLSIIVQLLFQDPWWLFIVVLMVLGVLSSVLNLSKKIFVVGFFAGAISWLIPTIYFRYTFGGNSFEVLSELTTLPVFIVYFLVAIVGGVLSGLALYVGAKMFS